MPIKITKSTIRSLPLLDKANQERAKAAIGQYVINQVGLEFKLSKDPFGNPWAPNAPSTIKRKKRKGKTGAGEPKVLIDTGNLRNSFSMKTLASGVEVGTPVPYAQYHQAGTGRIPQRLILPTAKSIPIEWQLAMIKIIGKLRGTGE